MSTADQKGGLPRFSGKAGLVSSATWNRLLTLVKMLEVKFDSRYFNVKHSSKGKQVTLRPLSEFADAITKELEITPSPLELTLTRPAYGLETNGRAVWVHMGSVGGAIASNFSAALSFNPDSDGTYHVYVQANLGQAANLNVTSCDFHISTTEPEFYDSWPATNARPSYIRIVLGYVVVTNGVVSLVSDKGNIHVAEYNVQSGSSFSRRIIFNRG